MQSAKKATQLLPGMYVRVPQEADRSSDFREFRIGQLRSINPIAFTALIRFNHPDYDELTDEEFSLDNLERCRVLPDTSFTTVDKKKSGRILIHCLDAPKPDQFMDYYVQFYGEQGTQCLSEKEIVVPSIRQNPLPESQLHHYEFQNPNWKSLRDQVIDSYHTLRNATYGIEDLVGSRIMLLSHQAEVVSRVLGDPVCRYILADEVGLGKTIEASVILRGLQRRDPLIKTLIIAPNSLTQQWQNELDSKFWLSFPLLQAQQKRSGSLNGRGYIVSIEDLVQDQSLWNVVSNISWGLLIVDEAHHLRKDPQAYERVRYISQHSQRALILSATPIQRRAGEYLKLLALMDPSRYAPDDKETFATMLTAQNKIRRKVVTLAQDLNPDDFDAEEFEEEFDNLQRTLKHDQVLRALVKGFSNSSAQTPAMATQILAYISENYRIESRVIRNRRAHLTIPLPQRELDTSYSYIPAEEETVALDTLYDYIEAYTQSFSAENLEDAQFALVAEYCRILMHAAASSPHALLHILKVRIKQLQRQPALSFPEKIPSNLISFTTPRLETQRITQVVNSVPTLQDEYSNYLDVLLWRTRTWQEQTEQELTRLSTSRGSLKTSSSHRLGQVLLALESVASSNKKAVVFSAWQQTLAVLIPHLRQRHGKAILAQFNASMPTEELQEEVNLFQESDRCRILLCDELGGEGRNFQIASQIIHIDLPWTPAQLEQRIGRVDRLGRQGSVLSIIPFAQEWPENDLFRIWQEAFQLFTQSMSGLEIALEGIQDALLEAIIERPRTGLANIIPDMIEQSAKLRKSVDEERYYEEVAVNRQLRDEFERISEDYSDGKKLSIPILKWADLCGLEHDYDPGFDIVTYTPQRFNTVKRLNAKLFDFPNMEEALQRSGRRRELVLRGSFNRSVAVQREQLVFFAPSSDKWTDAIIANALESDRGRCCAIQRRLPDIKGTWEGVELLYSLAIDPRPLYAAGFDPTHLFRALGYLRSTLHRMVISLDGKVQSRNSLIWNTITKTPYSDSRGDIHLGRRDESYRGSPQIQKFKQQHPPEEWSAQLNTIFSIAEDDLAEELAFMQDEADIAKSDFTQRAAGLRAADLWLQRASGKEEQRQNPAIEEYERISEALVEGIRHPLHQVESICFWRLEGKH